MSRRARASRTWPAVVAAIALATAACAGDDRRPAAAARPLAAAAATAPTAGPSPTSPPPAPGLLDRIAVLGASVSAGLAAQPVATSLRAGLPADAAVLDQASVLFFQDPFVNGRAQVDAALAHRPTLVLALDFLFRVAGRRLFYWADTSKR